MKKYLKLFFIVFLFLGTNSINRKVQAIAVYERTGKYIFSTKCPEPPNEDTVSICGIVRRSIPNYRELPDNTTHIDVQEGVAGVSVYLYEADNSSFSSGKREGKLVHLFSSTSTNGEGEFHILARKMDNNLDVLQAGLEDGYVDRPLQANIRYLVFSCGGGFAGMQVLPSFESRVDVIQEVPCKKDYTYVPPPNTFTFFDSNVRVAADMGIPDYPDEYEIADHSYLSDNINFPTRQSIDIYLEGADPRFTKPEYTPGKEDVVNILFEDAVPKLGAFWSRDCFKKYADTKYSKWVKLCAGADPGWTSISGDTLTYGTNGVPVDYYGNFDPNNIRNMKDQNLIAEIYYSKLLNNTNFLIQPLLPNISPREEILYFRPFETSVDITNYVKDPADIARFLGLHYANCPGIFTPRFEGSQSEVSYLDCEVYRECNETVNSNNSATSRTAQLAGGVSQGLQGPLDLVRLFNEMDLDIPVCIKDGEIITAGEIQPPGGLGAGGSYKLSSDYWSNEFLVHKKGQYNNVSVEFKNLQVEKDSLYPLTDRDLEGKLENVQKIYGTDRSIFQAQRDGKDETVSVGGGIIHQSGGDRPMPLRAAYAISHGDESIENVTNGLSSPLKDERYERQIIAVDWIYSTKSPYQYVIKGSINSNFANIDIKTPSQDESIFQNTKFGDGLLGNLNHYPIEDIGDLSVGNTINTNPNEGTRARTSAMYKTTPGQRRLERLAEPTGVDGNLIPGYVSDNFWTANRQGMDVFDSLLSIFSGETFVDWVAMSGYAQEAKNLSNLNIFEYDDFPNSEKKTFLDRNPTELSEDYKDDLRTSFPISEANFKNFFWLPSYENGNLLPDEWGPAHGCYPWVDVPFNTTCDTYQGEPKCDDGTVNPGATISKWGYGISRTCKVQECYASYAEGECTCTRVINTFDMTDPDNPQPIYDYTLSNCTKDVDDVDIELKSDGCTKDQRRVCAQKQKTCTGGGDERDCLRKTYEEEIERDIIEKLSIKSDEDCKNLDWDSTCEPLDGYCVKKDTEKTGTPQCKMMKGDGNICDGSIRRNETILIQQQVIDADKTNPQQDRINVDSVVIAGPELRQSFDFDYSVISPIAGRFATFPAEFTSVNTSVREYVPLEGSPTEMKESEKPNVGDAEGMRIRSMFTISPYFGDNTKFKEIYIHCTNSFFSSSGVWECQFNTLPNPEATDNYQLVNY
ncbi:hypothetical protein K0B04_01700 [Patescibacteria group bacterium]|nr:hypothetical protein [Patescibacteria group bacterium]